MEELLAGGRSWVFNRQRKEVDKLDAQYRVQSAGSVRCYWQRNYSKTNGGRHGSWPDRLWTLDSTQRQRMETEVSGTVTINPCLVCTSITSHSSWPSFTLWLKVLCAFCPPLTKMAAVSSIVGTSLCNLAYWAWTGVSEVGGFFHRGSLKKRIVSERPRSLLLPTQDTVFLFSWDEASRPETPLVSTESWPPHSTKRLRALALPLADLAACSSHVRGFPGSHTGQFEKLPFCLHRQSLELLGRAPIHQEAQQTSCSGSIEQERDCYSPLYTLRYCGDEVLWVWLETPRSLICLLHCTWWLLGTLLSQTAWAALVTCSSRV